jgi:hypothetical protein
LDHAGNQADLINDMMDKEALLEDSNYLTKVEKESIVLKLEEVVAGDIMKAEQRQEDIEDLVGQQAISVAEHNNPTSN